ncbi:MAG: rhodoquinone biosynthesis methyltransferase RquA [Rhodobacterales bacterium]|nr:rhodoquinone biosynthesis methyltransferase RquA [Rhodobacterales bacterium]
MSRTYTWAYIDPQMVRRLDRNLVVWSLLWGNSGRLMQAAFQHVPVGGRVLQAAYVYGEYTRALARHVGADGFLDVIDIVPLQVENCRARLRDLAWADARHADAADPGEDTYDAVCCYFLLHEMPHDKKRAVVDALLDRVEPGGTAVFVDYHRPARWHPLRSLMTLVWRRLEPYAEDLLETEIPHLTDRAADFQWEKTTYFGGLYQKVVARRR